MMKISILHLIVILDFIVMGMGMVIPISNYNAIINAIYCLPVLLFAHQKGNLWLFIGISACYFCLVSNNRLYSLFDVFTIINAIGLILLFSYYSISTKEVKFTQNGLIIFYVINLIMALIPSKYISFDGEVRFMGIFNACNLSVSAMTICGVAIWEIEKRTRIKVRWKLLLMNILGLVILIIATRTRTVLFLLPYWLYQSYNTFNRKVFVVCIILGCGLLVKTIAQSLTERLNLEGDSSFDTRLLIYNALIDEILRNNIVIPHGSNEAFFFIERLTGDRGFSSHNDYLRYIYDWGIYFFVFMTYIFKELKKHIQFNIECCLILLGYSAFALHNMLFLPIMWVPFCLIINMRKCEFNGNRFKPYSNKQLALK